MSGLVSYDSSDEESSDNEEMPRQGVTLGKRDTSARAGLCDAKNQKSAPPLKKRRRRLPSAGLVFSARSAAVSATAVTESLEPQNERIWQPEKRAKPVFAVDDVLFESKDNQFTQGVRTQNRTSVDSTEVRLPSMLSEQQRRALSNLLPRQLRHGKSVVTEDVDFGHKKAQKNDGS
ncbi:MAG: hypothetical protein MHM6MM_000645 [Cercozoa sp. M6MM]